MLAEIRSAAARVAEVARYVRIDHERLERYVAEYAQEPPDQPREPEHGALSDEETTVAFVVARDAINFGSGWHPVLRKRPGCSGSVTIAVALREWFAADPPTAGELAAINSEQCAARFGQDPALELMGLFATALNELGTFVVDGYGGSFRELVAAAGQSAERLVRLLNEMPTFHDVWPYDDIKVPLFKRAQITPHDLALAFDGRGPGHFEDIDSLTMFADNLVPHVLRLDGVLVYDDDLVARIDRGELLEPGAAEEVEIRAVALHAVELLAELVPQSPREIDELLWRRGGAPEYKAVPRHRCRTTAY